jgi:hypothetical protein
MAAAPQTPYRAATTVVSVGGTAAVAMYGPLGGGFITNPASAADQGIGTAEVLFVDLTGPAALKETGTTVPIQPGATFIIPAGQTTNVSVNAKTSGHKFSAVVIQPATQFPPGPQAGVFPPALPTTMTAVIPSYLYREYADDDALQAFVAAFNELTQGYVDWFVDTPLAVYTSPAIAGELLDWVAEGLYGMMRPALSSGLFLSKGPFGTYTFGSWPFGQFKVLGPVNVAIATDDVFKRILTWNLYRGDGNVFSIRWLKRRVMRFLTGANGSAPNVDNTSPVSVSAGAGIISISLSLGTRKVIGGALFGQLGYGGGGRVLKPPIALGMVLTVFVPGPSPLPLAPVLQEAIASGVLVLPFQYEFVVTI